MLFRSGRGADLFVFQVGDGAGEITDFHIAQDRLVLDHALVTPGDTAADLVAGHARVRAAGVVFQFDDGTRIVLVGLTSTVGLTGRIDFV